jgi:hypothetical protein
MTSSKSLVTLSDESAPSGTFTKGIRTQVEAAPAWNTVEGELVAAHLHNSPETKERYEQVDRECRDCVLCGMPASGSLVLSFLSRNTPLEEQAWWGTGLCGACYNAPDSAGKVFAIAIADIRLRSASVSGEGRVQ